MSTLNSFQCKDCHCFFKKKQGYEYHLVSQKHNTRIANDKVKLHSCSICQKTFMHSSGLSRHRIKCKKNEIKDISKVDILEKKVVELSKEVEDLKKHNNTNIGNQNNIQTQNNIQKQTNNIIINCFGNENLDYITDKVILHCMERIYGSIPLLIEKIHFDPEHPENHNVYIPNKKLSHAKIMNHKREWQIVNKKDTIENMMDIGYNMLDEKFQEKGHELTDFKQQRFRDFKDKYEDGNKKTQREIRNNVEKVITDKKNVCIKKNSISNDF
jgi:hypothetical protein